jgi:hypothetical protein
LIRCPFVEPKKDEKSKPVEKRLKLMWFCFVENKYGVF